MEIFKLVGSIFVNTDDADKSMQKTEKNAESIATKFGNGVKTVAKWGTAIVTATATAGTAIFGLATDAASTADEIDKMSQKIGISAEAYQEWAYVMGQNGMDVDKLSTGMKTLVAQMDAAASGTKSAQENFDKLGISIYNADGSLKDQETILNETMHALADMENGTEKARLATELFGKAGIEMMPMLNQGSEAMDDLTQRAHDLGLVMSDDAVKAGVTLGDTIDDIKQSFAMIGTNLGTAVIPIIQQFADLIVENMPLIQESIGALAPILADMAGMILPVIMDLAQTLLPIILDLINQLLPVLSQIAEAILPVFTSLLSTLLPPLIQIVQSLAPLIVTVLNAITPLLSLLIELLQPIIQLFVDLVDPILEIVSEAIQPLIEVVSVLLTTALKPLIEVVKAVGTIFSVTLKGMLEGAKPVIDNIIGIFKGITTFLKGIFTGDFKMAFQGIVDIVSNIFGGIINIVKIPINAIIDLINGFIGGLNKIKIPDWVPGLGGKGININPIPKLYTGGLVGAGTLISTNEHEPEIIGNYGNKTLVMNNAQIIETMIGAISATMESFIERITSIIGKDASAVGDIIIPVYIGNENIDEIIVNAKERTVRRSGGRAYA
ncbi:MAG: hypothetical protein HDR02_15000 [Lachnospiraceae bacterium]|nr:hypothetical protein [Lachnospiraceae bacterium]